MLFWKLYYHLVWGTKNRLPLLVPQIELQLYQFLVDRALEMDVFIYKVNGYLDHVHLVTAIPPKHAVATVVKTLKGSSSHYINDRGLTAEHFSWQRGYGALSLGEKQLPIAEIYVANQKQHHEEKSTNSWLEQTAEYDQESHIANLKKLFMKLSKNIPSTNRISPFNSPTSSLDAHRMQFGA